MGLSVRRLVRLVHVNDSQHHEQIGLQCDHQNVEDRPAKMHWQLPVSDQADHKEYDLAGKKVTVESQCQ